MNRIWSLPVLTLLVSALACGSPAPPLPGVPRGDGPLLDRLNSQARQGAVTETLHGVQVADPYRSLEEDSQATRTWLDAQTERTGQILERWTRPAMAGRLRALLSIGEISGVGMGGSRYFYQKREGDREQPLLMVHDGGQARPLVDPETYGDRAALDWYYPSPGGRYVAFGISQNGDERSTLRIVEVGGGEVLDDSIEHTKWASLSWLHDEAGFYYTRYPRAGEPNHDAEHEDTYFPRVFFHRIGTASSEDPLVFGANEGTDFPDMEVSDDDRWVVLNVMRGWSATDVHLFDRGEYPDQRVDAPPVQRRRRGRRRRATPPPAEHIRAIVTGRPHLTTGVVHEDELYLFTNEDAPRYRIARVPIDQAQDRGAWQDVVPQGPQTLQGWTFAGGKLAVRMIDDVRSRVYIYSKRGDRLREVELPASGAVGRLGGQFDQSKVVFAFSSYLYPPSLLTYDVQTGRVTRLDRVESSFDFAAYRMERTRVESADGTEIPLTVLRGADLPRDNDRPAILYGYGGFNISLLPRFRRHVLYWLERGGIFAIANLRGGGEFGEHWHQAGNLGNKERVFEDFEAAIRWLDTSGWSRPARIGITGGSNGGLLMGAMLTRVPDTFRAAASYVGLYDMVRYHRFPPAELWVSEYGSAEDAEQFAWLYAYSPYHRVEHQTRYPAALIETADHDSRVFWGHSAKMAARLQQATAAHNQPILFYMVRGVGHGVGTRLSDDVDEQVRRYTFFEHELDLGCRGRGEDRECDE